MPEGPITFENGYVNGIIDLQTVESIREMLKIDVIIKDSKGNVLSETAVVGTGSVIRYNDTDYTIVIKGDINGDGKVDAIDYLMAKRAFLKTYSLNDVQLKAACLENTVLPTTKDYLKIKRHFLGTFNLYA
ncbi:MAG: hypothetical protein CVU97_03855 [Firmicutes bacterium HGW-Firmicutes-21]|nr:MAG: hypothetical protein CVU97_03855 [Firmicutes bacterium HGW-Firmicutes-21]